MTQNFGGKQQVGKAYTEHQLLSSVFLHTFTPSVSSQFSVLTRMKQQVLNQEGKKLPELLLVDNDLMSHFTAHFHTTKQVTEPSSPP